MDAQQELYSALLMALKTKFKDTGIDVYDTFLPPDGTPYPFIYLGDNQVVDDYGNTTTSQPLLHGVLDLEFEITGGKQQ